ncbi:U-scoloptoxin(05)-Er1a-like [Ylistrum balloti]|uniref:U-scoloptoxin(05)-Er1a-like n=1 Tax=Ylistrum balloti TaxID=509963 RepID=UPI0029059AE5|nr:U-scoloptoxin(05)-Er1a-like [Ylistrum balloti]
METYTCGCILFLLWTCLTYSQARLCYTCGYNKPTDGTIGINCVNETSKLFNRQTKCSDDRVCTFDVQFNRDTNELVSVNRNCLPFTAPRSNQCVDDWSHRQCTYSCSTDLCNNMTAAELNNIYGGGGVNSAHPLVQVVSLVYSILAVCVVWVL